MCQYNSFLAKYVGGGLIALASFGLASCQPAGSVTVHAQPTARVPLPPPQVAPLPDSLRLTPVPTVAEVPDTLRQAIAQLSQNLGPAAAALRSAVLEQA